MSRAPESTEWVALGVLGKPRGLRGEVWFRSYNDASEAVAPGVTVRLTLRDGATRKAVVASTAVHGQERCVSFQGGADRVSAEALVGATVALQRQDFPWGRASSTTATSRGCAWWTCRGARWGR